MKPVAQNTIGPFEGWTVRPDDVWGPNDSGYYTAGIDVPVTDIFGRPDTHGHAMQFHAKDRDVAVARRDLALAAPDMMKAIEGLLAEFDKLTRYGSPMAKAANTSVNFARYILDNAKGKK